jgi:hypothetical protein
MKGALAGAALALLVLAAGCDRLVTPRRPMAQSAWEEGLTLAYEDPSLAPELRLERRQQVRVQASQPTADGLQVTKTFTTVAGQWEIRTLEKDGGVRFLTGSQGAVELLPEGFPDRVDRWESRGLYHWVVGRAVADLPGVRLPDLEHATGVWVESAPLDGPGVRTRTLYLPELGEAETRTWTGGRWVTTNILVARGFTDLPKHALTAASPTPGSTP